MATAITPATSAIDWRQEWHEFEGTTYLNLAGQSPIPKSGIKAIQAAIEWKKFPQQIPDTAFFDVPNKIRTGIAALIGANPRDIALTTGASTGMLAVAFGLDWKRGDEVLTAVGEFPLQYTTWKPMEEREGITLKIVSPSGRFLIADDFIAALSPKTRLVSASFVRFDNSVLLDAARLAAACHAQGTLLLLDVSQACAAVPMNVAQLGADFLICAGYKWLLGPFGTGFFWAKSELLSKFRPGPFYWMAAEGAENFAALAFADPKPVASARRFDSAETASYYNLAALEAGLDLVSRIGVENIAAYNHKLIDLLFARLSPDRFVISSPLDGKQRGPYGCFQARSPEKTREYYEKLKSEKVITSLREGQIRISPYVYNSERDIDRVISVVTT